MNKVAMYKEEIFKTANEKRMSPAEQVVDNQKKTYATKVRNQNKRSLNSIDRRKKCYIKIFNYTNLECIG